MEDIQPTGVPPPAAPAAGSTPGIIAASNSSSPPVTTSSDFQFNPEVLPSKSQSDSTAPHVGAKYNWTLVTKTKSTAVAIPLDALPGDSLAAKKEYAFKLIPAEYGVTHFGPKRSTILIC